jgi:hypothetical protein
VAAVLANLKPAPETLLDRLDGPGVFALEMEIGPELMLAARPLIEPYLLANGTVADRKELAEYHARVAKEYTRVTGRVAMGWQSVPDEKGLFHFVYIEQKRPGAPKRDMRKHFEEIPGLKQTVGPLDVDVDVDEGVETHRGIAIDRVTITFKVKPAAAREMEEAGGPDMAEIIKLMFGETMTVYSADLVDRSLGSVGYANPDTLKALIDRSLEGRRGDLVGSPAWNEAMKRLPPARSGLALVSPAEMYRAILPPILETQMPGVAEDLEKVVFERPSAAGITWGPAPGGAVMNLNCPVAEMKNIRDFFTAMVQSMQRAVRQQFENAPQDVQ